MALAVTREGSVQGAARRLGRPASSVADAFERFERVLGLPLALRVERALSFTLTGETVRRASDGLIAPLAEMADLAGAAAGTTQDPALAWAAHHGIPMASLTGFTAVLAEGSIRRAARLRRVSQPQLSRQMSRLESVFGRPLLLRTKTGCAPSAAGLRLRDAALGLEARLSDLVAPTGARHAQGRRILKFGAIIPIGHESRLAAKLAGLVAQWGDAGTKQDLLVSSTTAEDLIEGLKIGRYDLALLDTAMPHNRFENLEVSSSELVLVGPPRIIAASAAPLSLVAAHPIALPSHRSGLRQRIWEVLGPVLEQADSKGPRSVEVDALSIVINLVLDHGYLSVLPIDAVTSLRREIGIVRFPEAPRVRFNLVWRRLSSAGTSAALIARFLAD
jgi:LysR family nitrogen assimilation transcriptional regulator